MSCPRSGQRVVSIGLGLVMSLLVSGIAAADQATFISAVRDVRRLQDTAAHGNGEAHRAIPAALATCSSALDKSAASTEPSDAMQRAVILYLLSGGDARPVKAAGLHAPRAKPKSEKAEKDEKAEKSDKGDKGEKTAVATDMGKALEAAMAYAEGRQEDAAEAFSGIDPLTYEPGLGAHLALMKAMLSSKPDAAALAALDQARLLAPGSLIEETALRRQVRLLAASHDPRLPLWIARYLAQYSGSPYGASFAASMAEVGSAMELSEAGRVQRDVLPQFKWVDPTKKASLMMPLIDLALASGKLDLAGDMIGLIKRDERSLSARDAADLRAYEAAIAVPMGKARGQLDKIEPTLEKAMSDKARTLMDALRRLDKAIVSPTQTAEIKADDLSTKVESDDRNGVRAAFTTWRAARDALAAVQGIDAGEPRE